MIRALVISRRFKRHGSFFWLYITITYHTFKDSSLRHFSIQRSSFMIKLIFTLIDGVIWHHLVDHFKVSLLLIDRIRIWEHWFEWVLILIELVSETFLLPFKLICIHMTNVRKRKCKLLALQEQMLLNSVLRYYFRAVTVRVLIRAIFI